MSLRGDDGTGLAPIHGGRIAVEAWLDSLPGDTSRLREDIAWAAVFSEQSCKPGRAQLDRTWRFHEMPSWLGGPALLPLTEWPRRPDGTPLAHVASFALYDIWACSVEEQKRAWPISDEGLPSSGYLEIFHDLVDTYGWEAEDRERGGWLVRWVPEPEDRRLADPPPDLDTPTEVCQVGSFFPGWMSRPSLDFLSDYRASELAEEVSDAVRRGWLYQRTGSTAGFAAPLTHVYGHSQNATAPALEVLRKVLPLDDGDRYRLIVEIESYTHLSGWFGDAASLEVWMRQSDLDARLFDRAWCITRTD